MQTQSLTIRAKLLWLTIGLVVPLVAVGFYNLWEFRQVLQKQRSESVEQQASLAATAFAQRIEAQRQTLETISILAAENENRNALTDYLNSIVKTRPAWLDVQIVNAKGAVVFAQSSKNLNLQAISIDALRQEIARKHSLVIVTEQSVDEKLRLLSLALPIADGGFVVARIDGSSVNGIFEQLKLPPDNIIAVFDSNNRLIYRSRVSPEQMSLDVSQTPLLSALRENSQGTVEIESPYDKIRRVYGLARVASANVVVIVGVPSAKLYEPARRQFLQQLIFSLVVTLLAVAAAFIIARNIVQPIWALIATARQYGAGDLTARTKVIGVGTIGELGINFNQMAEQISIRETKLRELDRLKSEFVSSVSHELRTPLTTIKTLTHVLQSDKISLDERKEFLATIAAECDRQIEFVQTLLDLSRIESGAYKVSLAETNVGKILEECVAAQVKAAASRKLKLKLVSSTEKLPHVLTDAGILRRITMSLIENSMKYTAGKGEIIVSAETQNKKIAVSVTDTGCGIAETDLPRIFERFYRGRPRRNEKILSVQTEEFREYPSVNGTSGIGLGLYLVKNLVGQIGGEITVQSPAMSSINGTTFTVYLPVAENSETNHSNGTVL